MKALTLSPNKLIPTDSPRSLEAIHRWIPYFVEGMDVPPVIVVPNLLAERDKHTDAGYLASWEHFVCQGNHRVAAAHICRRPIFCRVLTDDADLEYLTAGAAAKLGSFAELEAACRFEARRFGYSAGSWEAYVEILLGR